MSQTEDKGEQPARLAGWRGLISDLFQMVRFYSRLPMPKLPFEADAHAPPDFSRAPRMLPLAGLIIGLPGAAALLLASALGLPDLVAAVVCIAIAVLATGAFHEDGLADTFDGLGGGWTVERRLEIMKDSRIGSYGGAALMLSLILRTALIAALLEETGALATALLFLVTASVSRCMGLTPIILLPPARASGFSSTVGRPSNAALLLAAVLALAFAIIMGRFAGSHIFGLMLGILYATSLCLLMTFWAKRAIGGQTGDIAGACQQLAESALYAGMLTMFF